MNDETVRILAISGSLRHASFSTALIRQLAKQVSSIEITLHDISDIPLYNEDLEQSGKPAGVLRLSAAVEHSDGVLIVTPEYNHGLPGVLKNALDWVSRPAYHSAFRHKPASMMSSSLATTGGVRAQYQLRETLHSMLAFLTPGPEVAVGNVHTKFEGEALVDQKTLDFMMKSLEPLRAEAKARKGTSVQQREAAHA